MMLGRLGLSIALIISGGLLVGAPVAAADDGSGDLQPIVAGLPRAALPTSADTDVVVAGRRVSAIPTPRLTVPEAGVGHVSAGRSAMASSTSVNGTPACSLTAITSASESATKIHMVRPARGMK
jgi:hypothetical protein